MKIYNNLNYNTNINNIIKDCLNSSKDNPFNNHFIIVDDPNYFEEIIMHKTDTLLNIEIMNLQDFFEHISIFYHQNIKLSSSLDKMFAVAKILDDNPNNIYNQGNNRYENINQLLTIFDELYLDDINSFNKQALPQLSINKLQDIFDIYTRLLNNHDIIFNYHDNILNCIDDSLKDNYYYFITNKVNNKKSKKVITKLDQYCCVSILDLEKTTELESKDYADFTINNLFNSATINSSLNHPYQLIEESNSLQEIQQIIISLYQDVIRGYKYNQFALYYPNEEYYQLITKQLDYFNINYNDKKSVYSKENHALISLINYLLNHQDNDLVELINTGCLKTFTDLKQISLLKTLYLKKAHDNIAQFNNIKQYLDEINVSNNITDISNSILSIINDLFVSNEQSIRLVNFIKQLTYDYSISLYEYLQIVNIYLKEPVIANKPLMDSVYLLNYQQPYSEMLGVKKVFMLGMNETVIPPEFKNTRLILNNEALAINSTTTYDMLQLYQRELLNVFSNHHEAITLSYSKNTLSGSELVPSSIVIKLKKMYKIPVVAYDDYVIKDNLYEICNRDDNEERLNKRITIYQTTNNQVNNLSIKLPRQKMSASKLEQYNGCHYKYFNQYLLYLNPLEKDSFQSNEIGSLVHYVLEKNIHYYRSNKPVAFDNLQDDINQAIDQYLLDNLNNKLNQPINKFFINQLKQDLYNTILILNQQMLQGDFENIATEMRVSSKLNNVELNGIIDRVDKYQNYVKVIDYKSSNKDLNLDLAKLGFNIQMLLYLETLCLNNNYDKGAVLYFNTKKRLLSTNLSILENEIEDNFTSLYKMNGYSVDNVVYNIDNDLDQGSNVIKAKTKKDGSMTANSKVIDSETMQQLLDEIVYHINNLYDSLSKGNIDIYPTRSSNNTIDAYINPCTYCNYRSICNYDIFYNEDHEISIGGADDE